MRPVLLVAAAVWCCLPLQPLPTAGADAPRVRLVRTPQGGLQPQVVRDDQGATHLVFFKGDPKAGNLFYARQRPGESSFSDPIPVNAPGSAVAVGTIRGAQLALGRNGRVHIAWNGSGKAAGHPGAPMLYARLNEAGTAFEPERDLIHDTMGLDGGGSVAADGEGNVWVFWHGARPGNPDGEGGRAVWVAHSSDDGKTFAAERQANPKPTGACGCCALRAFADRVGNVYVLYRAAEQKLKRDEVLLVSRSPARDFATALQHPWRIPSCPMSSASFASSPAGTLAAWETDGQVFFAVVNTATFAATQPFNPPGDRGARRKHPSVAANARGQILLAWTEGTGWQKGGAVAWQIFDPTGTPTEGKGRADGVPVWGLVAGVPESDGSFVIYY